MPHGVDDVVAVLEVDGREVKGGAASVPARGLCPGVLASEEASGQRAPDQCSEARRLAVGDDLMLCVSADDRVIDLRRYEWGVGMAFLHRQPLRGVPGREV